MRKKLMSFIAALSFFAFLPSIGFTTGYPVFDASGWLAAIDQLYEAYDMVNNTITQIQNQYNMIQQNLERAKSIDWDNIKFDGDFDIRNDIRDATKRVNRLLTSARNIKKTITTPSINCGNAKYSIADLCGATSGDMWEGRQNIFTAITDYETYMTDAMKTAVDDVVEGLTDEQKEAIWAKYGISPQNYAFVQHAHTGVLEAAANIMANVGEEVMAGKAQESLLRSSEIIKAMNASVDSNGNITEASLMESMTYLFTGLEEHCLELENAIYKSASLSASKAIEEDAQKNAEKINNAKRWNDYINSSRISGRFRRN